MEGYRLRKGTEITVIPDYPGPEGQLPAYCRTV